MTTLPATLVEVLKVHLVGVRGQHAVDLRVITGRSRSGLASRSHFAPIDLEILRLDG